MQAPDDPKPETGQEIGGQPVFKRPQQPIVVVGASVRSAAESASRAGFDVIGIDLFGDSDTLAACRRHFRIVDGRISDQAVRHCAGLPIVQVGGLSDSREILAPLYPAPLYPAPLYPAPLYPGVRERGSSEWNLRDPRLLQHLATEAGLRFPASRPAADTSGHRQSIPSPVSAWLCKRRDSSGGLGVRWFAGDRSESDLLQQWVPGRSFGATLIAAGTKVALLGVCRSLFTRKGRCPFVYCGSLGPIRPALIDSAVRGGLTDRLLALGRQVVAETSFGGLLNVDLVAGRDGSLWLIEINPRWSGSSEIVERSLTWGGGESLFALMLDAMEGNSINQLPDVAWNDAPTLFLKRIAFARQRMSFNRNRVMSLQGDGVTIHDVPAQGTVIDRAQPICTVILRINGNHKGSMKRFRSSMQAIHESWDAGDS